MIKEALYYDKLDGDAVRCRLCPAECLLTPDKKGICRNRFNRDGRLMTDNFGETVTLSLDPIEKKPLYHFHPASSIISIGPNGCNLSCRHCQNWQISQENSPTRYIAPADLPRVAAEGNSVGVAYTYTEPFIWYEYLMEAAPLVKKAGLVNVMVTNGYVNPEPLKKLLPFIDAFNIDLKGMRPEFYKRVCKGKLEPVLDVIRLVAQSQSHLELTNLVIPGYNDEENDFRLLGEFISATDRLIPLHLSAYHPSYKMDNPATGSEKLQQAYRRMREYLPYVFVGNMEIEGLSHSYCRSCGERLIKRSGYSIATDGIDADGGCRACGTASEIIV